MTEEQYQCIGCGATIQTHAPGEIGYLPASALMKGLEKEQFYCQRCFRLRNYNELQDIEISDDVFLDRLHEIQNDEDAYIINLIDIFDVEGSLIDGLSRFIGHQPFAIVANKVDLLPHSTKLPRVTHWMREVVAQHGLKPEEVLLISASQSKSLDALIDLIREKVDHHNIYIVGVTNVGKSTLINQLIHAFGGEKEVITTSNQPGTTLDLIYIPLTDHTGIVDTPGIIRRTQMAHYVDRESYKTVMPTKTIKPMSFQLNPGQTIFMGGLGRVDYVSGPKMALTIYASRDLYLHRTKLDKADEFYQKHVGELLIPPTKEQSVEFPPLKRQSFKLGQDQDIAISGIGWLTANQDIQLDIWVPAGIQLSKRQSII